jgi:hypothetical protein
MQMDTAMFFTECILLCYSIKLFLNWSCLNTSMKTHTSLSHNGFIGLVVLHCATCFGSWSHHQAVQINGYFKLLNRALYAVYMHSSARSNGIGTKYRVGHPVALRHAAARRSIDSKRGRKTSWDMFNHVVWTTAHSPLVFLGTRSWSRMDHTTTSYNCCIGFMSGEHGGHTILQNPPECSSNLLWTTEAPWWVFCSHIPWKLLNAALTRA